jgi:hypothetical protein
LYIIRCAAKGGKGLDSSGGGGGVVCVRYVLKRAVSVDMYKRSVKDKVRWMNDNVNKRVEELK